MSKLVPWSSRISLVQFRTFRGPLFPNPGQEIFLAVSLSNLALKWEKLMFSIHFRSLIFLSLSSNLRADVFRFKTIIEKDWCSDLTKGIQQTMWFKSKHNYSQNIVFNLLPPSVNFKLWFLGEATRAFLEHF